MQARPNAPTAAAKGGVGTTRGMNPMFLTIASILISTILGVAGQLMLKQGMGSMGALQLSAQSVPGIVFRIATSPWVVGGLLVYGSGTFFWLMVLNRVPLSFSYPFIALGIVVGMVASWVVLHEQIPSLRWVGLAVICVGVMIVART